MYAFKFLQNQKTDSEFTNIFTQNFSFKIYPLQL